MSIEDDTLELACRLLEQLTNEIHELPTVRGTKVLYQTWSIPTWPFLPARLHRLWMSVRGDLAGVTRSERSTLERIIKARLNPEIKANRDGYTQSNLL